MITSKQGKEIISSDYATAVKQMAKHGFYPEEVPDWVEKEKREQEQKEEEQPKYEDHWYDYLTVPLKQLSSGTAQGYTELASSAGVLGSRATGTDPDDSLVYRFGTKATEMAEIDYLPNRFKGGATGLFFSDLPKGVGSALSFLGLGGIGGIIGKGAAKLGMKAGAKKLTSKEAMDTALKAETEALTKLSYRTRQPGPFSVPQQRIAEEAGKKVTKKFDAKVAKYEGMYGAKAAASGRKWGERGGVAAGGVGLSSMEGWRDAVATMRADAIKRGEDPDNIDWDVAWDAYWKNAPAGLIEVIGAAPHVLRAMRGASTIDDIAKHGADSLARQAAATGRATQLWKNLDKVSNGRFSKGLTAFQSASNNKWIHGATQTAAAAAAELTQESAQGLWLNQVASDIAGYDKNRQLFDGIVHQGGVGGLVGGVFGLVTMAFTKRARRVERVKNLESQADKAQARGDTEGAERLKGEASAIREELKAAAVKDYTASDVGVQEAQDSVVNAEAPKVTVSETLDLAPAAEAAPVAPVAPAAEAAPATEGAVPLTRVDAEGNEQVVTSVTQTAGPAEEEPSWVNMDFAGKEKLDIELLQEADTEGVLHSTVETNTKGEVTNAKLVKAVKLQKSRNEFEVATTETQTDDEIAGAMNTKAVEIATVKRKRPSPDNKGGEVYQVVGIDKKGNEVAILSPVMVRDQAVAFMEGAVHPAWSNLKARAEGKRGGPGKLRKFDEESFSRAIQLPEETGTKATEIPTQRSEFAARFRGKADPKNWREQETRFSPEIAAEVAERQAAEEEAVTEEAPAPAEKPAKRARSTKAKAAAKKVVAEKNEEDDFIAATNEELEAGGGLPLTAEEEQQRRQEWREGQTTVEAEPVAAEEEVVEEPSATASLEDQAAALEAEVKKNLDDLIDPSATSMMGVGAVNAEAAAKLTVNGAKLGVVYARMGIVSFKKWSKKMLDTFGESIRPYLKRIYKATDQQAQDEGIEGTEELTSKQMDAQLKQLAAKPAKKKPAKKNAKGQAKAKQARKAKTVAKKMGVAGKSPRQAVSKDKDATVSDVKVVAGVKPTIMDNETAEPVEAGDVENVGPWPNKGLAQSWVNRKNKKSEGKDYWVFKNEERKYEVHSKVRPPAVELITADSLSPLDAALKKRQAEEHEEALQKFEPAEMSVGRAGQPVRTEEELEADTEEELRLTKEKQKILGKLKVARSRKQRVSGEDVVARRGILDAKVKELEGQLSNVTAQLKGLVRDVGPGYRGSGVKNDTIFRGDLQSTEEPVNPELTEDKLNDRISTANESQSGTIQTIGPDKRFDQETIRLFKDTHTKPEEIAPDHTEISTRGLRAVLKDRLIKLIRNGGPFEGLPVDRIEFRTSKAGAPMFVSTATGDTTINVDVDKLAYYMSGPQETVSYEGGTRKTTSRKPKSLEKMIKHELYHVLMNRALTKGYVKHNKKGEAVDHTPADLNTFFGRIAKRNVEVLELMMSRGEGQYMFDKWRAHYAINFGQELAEQLVWLPDVQREGKSYKGKISFGKVQSKTQEGQEWLVFLLEEAGNHEKLDKAGLETLKYSTKKMLTYLTRLQDADVGGWDYIPPAIQQIIKNAELLVARNNVFAQRASYLEGLSSEAGTGMDRVEEAWLEMQNEKTGGDRRITEWKSVAGTMSYVWDYMVDDAYHLGQLLDGVDGMVYVPGAGKTRKVTMPSGLTYTEEVVGRSRKVPVSVQSDWYVLKKERDNGREGSVMVVTAKTNNSWSRMLSGIAKHTGNKLTDLKRNNPHLGAGKIEVGEKILVYPTKNFKYNANALKGEWYKHAADKEIRKKKRDRSPEMDINIDLIMHRLSNDATYQSLSTRLGDINFKTEVEESERSGEKVIKAGLLTEAAEETTRLDDLGKLDDVTVGDEFSVRPGMDSASQAEENNTTLGQIAATDTVADMIMESNEDGVIPFDEVANLDLGISPNEVVIGMQAVMNNMQGDGLASVSWDRAAAQLQAYHNTRATEFMAGEELIQDYEREIQRTEGNKPRGYKAQLAILNELLDEAKASQQERGNKYQSHLLEGQKPRKLEINGKDLELTIMPAFRKAFRSSSHTGQSLRIAWRYNEMKRRGELDEANFPSAAAPPDSVEALFEMITDDMDSPTKVSRSGENTYLATTKEEQEGIVYSISNYIKTGDPQSTESVNDVSASIDRATRVLGLLSNRGNRAEFMADLNLRAADDWSIAMGGQRGLIDIKRELMSKPNITNRDRARISDINNWFSQHKGRIISNSAQSMRMKQLNSDLLGHHDASHGYEESIRRRHLKDFGNTVAHEWHSWVKDLMSTAGREAALNAINDHVGGGGVNPVKTLVDSGLITAPDEVNAYDSVLVAVQKALARSASDEVIDDQSFINNFRAELDLAGIGNALTTAQEKQVASLMMRIWKQSRLASFKRGIQENHAPFTGGKVTLDTMLGSAQRLLDANDIGVLSLEDETMVKIDGVDVPLPHTALWDALAPSAYGVDAGYFGDHISRKLMELAEKIEQEGLEGVRAAQVREEMVQYVLANTPVDPESLIRDLWFAGALSGTRTWVDIGTGSVIHGAVSTILLSTEVAVFNTGTSRMDSLTIINNFIKGLWQGGDGLAHILRTGDTSKLPDANERLKKMLDTQTDYYGGSELEKLALQKEKWGSSYANIMKFVRRMVIGLDYVGATAGRRAMLVYGATTRNAAIGQEIATETNPKRKAQLVKEADKLKKAYNSGMAMADKREQEKALERSVRDIHGSKYNDQLAPADIARHKGEPLVKARSREIMEADLDELENLTQSASEMGRVFALNAEPIGLGGVMHRMLQKAGPFKYPLGFTFSRAAMNIVSNASNFIPIFSLFNFARSQNTVVTDYLRSTRWYKASGLDIAPSKGVHKNVTSATEYGETEVMSKERQSLIRAQAITSTALGIAVLAWLWEEDEKDDEEGSVSIIGSLKTLSISRQRQLRSQGVKPHSIRLGKHYVSYKNTPFAAWFAGIGNLHDGRKWGDFDDKEVADKFINMTLGGFAFLQEMDMTSQAVSLMQSVSRSGDMYEGSKKIASQFAQGWVGPIVSPTLMREVDSWVDPTYYKPGKDQFMAHLVSQLTAIPGLPDRRMGRPMLNAFGEEVEVARVPWHRWYEGKSDIANGLKKYPHPSERREWLLAAKWARQGTFLQTGGNTGRKVVGADLKKRDMTAGEIWLYQKNVGEELKKHIIGNIDALEKATPRAAERWLDKVTSRIKSKVARQISRSNLRADQ